MTFESLPRQDIDQVEVEPEERPVSQSTPTVSKLPNGEVNWQEELDNAPSAD